MAGHCQYCFWADYICNTVSKLQQQQYIFFTFLYCNFLQKAYRLTYQGLGQGQGFKGKSVLQAGDFKLKTKHPCNADS